MQIHARAIFKLAFFQWRVGNVSGFFLSKSEFPAYTPHKVFRSSMNRLLAACALCLALLPTSLRASAKESKIDPAALESLKKVCATLSAASAFTYETKGIVEAPTTSGQTITLFPAMEVSVKKPDKLRVELRGEGPAFDFFYNGKTAIASAPESKNYSISAAPPTLDEMLPALEKETGIHLVTAPLLFKDPYAVIGRPITSAAVIGSSVVDGMSCQHLAFRSPGVDWELWVDEGGKPLPRRLVVNFTDQRDLARVLVEFSKWNLRPWLRDSSFEFSKPADGHEIPFQSVNKPE